MCGVIDGGSQVKAPVLPGTATAGPARWSVCPRFAGSPARACGWIFAGSVTAWRCDALHPRVLRLAGAQNPALDVRMGGGIVPRQPPEATLPGVSENGPALGLRAGLLICLLLITVLRWFMLFSGRLLNFILKICLHSI